MGLGVIPVPFFIYITMSKIDTIQVSGSTYDITTPDLGGLSLVKLTQAEYDALISAGTVSNTTVYYIVG